MSIEGARFSLNGCAAVHRMVHGAARIVQRLDHTLVGNDARFGSRLRPWSFLHLTLGRTTIRALYQ